MKIVFVIFEIVSKEICVPNNDSYRRTSETWSTNVLMFEQVNTDEVEFTTEQQAEQWLQQSELKGQFVIQKTYKN